MKKNSKKLTAQSRKNEHLEGCTIGLDVSDKYTYAAVLNAEGELIEEVQMRTREPELRSFLMRGKKCVVGMETGTHARWMERVGKQCGHEVVVGDARQLRLIYGGTNKTDRLDAEKLARLVRLDRKLMNAVQHREEGEHADLAVIAARELMVRMRVEAINTVRGMVKSAGGRVEGCQSEGFTRLAGEALPEQLRKALGPVLEQVDGLSELIREYDEQIEHLAQTKYPEVKLLKQVKGVGTLAAMTFRLTIGNGQRFGKSRDVGCYVGLRPKRDQSGEWDPKLGISKTGNSRLRRTLVNCAHYILGPFGPDTDLRRWGLGLAQGGKNAKKKAVVAVARKLAVLMHRLMVGGEVYEPLRQAKRREAGAMEPAA